MLILSSLRYATGLASRQYRGITTSTTTMTSRRTLPRLFGAADNDVHCRHRHDDAAPSAAAEDSSQPTDPPAVLFDAEISKIYSIIAENHRHPNGPWVTMLDKIHQYSETTGRSDFALLDLATGPGEPAETIARQFPDCTVVATDMSPDQVAIANSKAITLPHLTCQVADMQDLAAFDDDSFDLVTCCYGFMFPPDIPKAVQESYRVLKPGGQLIATTWNKIAMMMVVRAVMKDILGQDPPPQPFNPMSLAEPGLFESMLQGAGYESIATSTHEYPFDFSNDPELQYKAGLLVVKAMIDELDAWDKAKASFDKIKLDYGAYSDHGHLIVPDNQYKLTVATKPSSTTTDS